MSEIMRDSYKLRFDAGVNAFEFDETDQKSMYLHRL